MLWNKCWAALLVGASIFSSVLASPIPATPRDTHLSKRDHDPEDAADYEKVLEWMEVVRINKENMVFYTGGKQAEAQAFVEANKDYAYFSDIFGADFQKEFGGVAVIREVAAACSKAMALHAKGEIRVFGNAIGKSTQTQPTAKGLYRALLYAMIRLTWGFTMLEEGAWNVPH